MADKKFTQRNVEDPWIEVMHYSRVSKKRAPYFFRASMIDHVEEGKNGALIFLKSDTVLEVSLPVAELLEKLNENISPLDLKMHSVDIQPQIGQTFGTKGIFIGRWELLDKGGKSLGKVFNIFSAPEDLTDSNRDRLSLTFTEAARAVASLKNWHGHDGGNFENEVILRQSLINGIYQGEWCIPPLDLLGAGYSPKGCNLYEQKILASCTAHSEQHPTGITLLGIGPALKM